ncbi:MAG: ATP:cob(I)alamin adenosyltransferase [Pontiellaceae bacterium]
MVKIYTGFGDYGETRRYDGKTVKKNDPIIELNGIIDECNSVIGIARSFNKDNNLEKILKKIQNKLFTAGSEVSSFNSPSKITIKYDDILKIEEIIDNIDSELDKLKNFILPSGNLLS